MVELIFMLNMAIGPGCSEAIDQWSKHPWSEMLLCGRAYIHVEHGYRPVV